MIHLRRDDYRLMPWKNGLGSTTEIARVPLSGDFDWRVSIADVPSDGPFSIFTGIDRIIVPIEGAGMRLTHAAQVPVTLGPFEPHPFRGDDETFCHLLAGPIRDFNLMTRRERCSGRISVIRTPQQIQATLLYCARGRVELTAPAASLSLEKAESLVTEEQEAFEVRSMSTGGVIIAVSVTAIQKHHRDKLS